MFDLQSEISKSFSQLSETGEIKNMVTDKLRDSIKNSISRSIEDMFSYNGELKKVIHEVVTTQLKISVSDFDLPSYQQVILERVNAELSSKIETLGVEKIKECVNDMLESKAPDTFSFKKIIEKFKKEEFQYDDGVEGEISIHIEDCDHIVFIKFDKENDREKYQCSHALSLKKEDEKYYLNSYEVDGRAHMESKSFGRGSRFDDFMFSMYSVATEITDFKDIDIDDLRYYDTTEESY